jgi:serine/threonine protein kinase
LKLIDFGLSCNFNYGNCNKLAGTKSYFPPNYKKLIKDLNINKRIKLFDYYAFALVCFILINKNLRVLNEINNNIEPTFKKFNKFYRENLNLQTFLNKIVDYLKINPVFENIL